MAGNSQEEENFDQTLHHCDQQSVQAERLVVQSGHFAAESFPIEAAGATCQGAAILAILAILRSKLQSSRDKSPTD